MAKEKVTSLDQLYDGAGNVLCRFCESCDPADDIEGYCGAVENHADASVLLDIAECDCGELVSKELAELNKRVCID